VAALSWRAQESLMKVAALAYSGKFSEYSRSPLLTPVRLQHVLTFPEAGIYEVLRNEIESLSLGMTSLRMVDKRALQNPSRAKRALFFTTCSNMAPEGVILEAPFNHADKTQKMKAFGITSTKVVGQHFKA